MFKKILFFVVLISFGFALWWGYNYFVKVKIPVLPALSAVPTNAAAVFQFKNIESTWSKIISSDKMWKDLLQIKSFTTINESAEYLNQVILKNGEFRKMLNEKPLVISLHLSGAQSYDYLYCISLPSTKNPEEVKTEIISLLNENQILNTKKYDQDEIYSIPIDKLKSDLFFTIKNHILIFSFSPLLIEDALRNINLPDKEKSNNIFKELEKSPALNTDGNIYVNYKLISKLVSFHLKNETSSTKIFKSNFANWAGFDLTINPNSINLNGFTYTEDSTNNYINLFKTQQPQEVNITSLIPYNTSYFLDFGFSDFQLFLKNYKEYLDKDKSLFNYTKNINALEQDCGCDITNSAINWIGNEAAVVITEPNSEDYLQNKYLVFATLEIEKALEQLAELSLQLKDTLINAPKEEYKGFTIYSLHIHNLYESLLGESFSKTDINAYTAIDDFIVFGNSYSSIKSFLNNYTDGKVLKSEVSFTQQSSKIEDKSNILLYSNLARSSSIYKNHVKEKHIKDLESNKDTFDKFDAFSFQCSNFKNDLFYTNIVLQHNPIVKIQEAKSWQVDIGKKILLAPTLLENHVNKEKEIFVQDEDNSIYLINAEGKILWKKELKEKIRSVVKQIDLYKNNKLQIVFNTEKFIYVIDRNGENVEGFPIPLPSKAASGVAVLDYDQSREYRFLISCENKTIYNFGSNGKALPNWSVFKTSDLVSQTIQHIRIQDKDYIFALERSGKISLLDRQGKSRLEIKNKLVELANYPVLLSVSKDINSTLCIYLNKKGDLISQSFGGTKKILLSDVENFNDLQLIDFSEKEKQEIIIKFNKNIVVLTTEGKKVFEHTISSESNSNFEVFKNKRTQQFSIYYFDSESDKIEEIDTNGKSIQSISLQCDGRFAVGSLKNNEEINIVSIDDTFIFIHPLAQKETIKKEL